MPTPPPDEPITRITINLFTSDILHLKKITSEGYQRQIRDIIHRWVMKDLKIMGEPK